MRRMPRLVIWAFIAVACAVIAARADFGSTLAALLPDDDSELGREVRFFATQRAAQLLAFEAIAITASGDAPGELRALGDILAPFGAQALGAGGAEAMGRLEQVLYDHLPALLTTADLEATTARLAGAGLDAHLAALRTRASDPVDHMTATAAQGDVLGLAARVLAPLREHLAGAASDRGIIPHGDGHHHLLLTEVAFAPDDRVRTSALMDAVDTAVAAAAERGVRIEAIGSHRHFRDNLEGIHADLLRSLPLGLFGILLMLRSLVRRPMDLLALHVPAIIALLAGVAAVVAAGMPVPLLLVGFAAGFLGVAVDNALHMTVAAQQGRAAAVRHPLLVGCLTTTVAFTVLLASSIGGLRSLALLVVAGLVAALLASLTLLPALVRRRDTAEPWAPIRRLGTAVVGLPPAVRVGLVLVLSLLCLPGLTRLRVIDDLRALDGSRPETVAALDGFLSRWDRFETSDFLVAHGDDLASAQEAFARARSRLGGAPTVVDVLLPAPSVQAERLAAWNAFWDQHTEPFAGALAERLGKRGFAATAISRARYQSRTSVEMITPATWTGTPFATLIDQHVLHDDDGVRLAAPLEEAHTPEQVAALRASLGASDQAWIASRRDLAANLVAVVRSDLGRLALWMAVAMATLVLVLERRPRAVLAILLPPALALLWGFGLLGWLGLALSPFSVMVCAFIAGIGIDSAVFLARPAHRAQAYAPVFAATATTVIGVGSLMLASNPLLRETGIALTLGMTCCLITCLLLTPLIMDGWQRKPR